MIYENELKKIKFIRYLSLVVLIICFLLIGVLSRTGGEEIVIKIEVSPGDSTLVINKKMNFLEWKTLHYTFSSLYKSVKNISEKLPELPLTTFFHRENSNFIYATIFLILIYYERLILKRSSFLIESYSSYSRIQKELLEKVDSNTRKKSAQDYSKYEKNNCFLFIFRSYGYDKIPNESNQTSKHNLTETYKHSITREEDSYIEFEEQINRCNMWIIRMGILGTLFGIMLAFYEIAEGIPSIRNVTSSEAFDEFKNKLTFAILGNAVAVITSVVAHTVSLLIEVFVSNNFRDKTNINWLHETYSKLSTFPEFNNPVETAKDEILSQAEELRIKANKVITSLEELEKTASEVDAELTKANSDTKSIKTNTEKTVAVSNTVIDSFHKIDQNADDLKNQTGNLKEEFKDIKTTKIKNNANDIEKQSDQLKEEFKKIEPVKILINTTNSIEVSKNLADQLKEINIEAVRDNIKTLSSFIDGFIIDLRSLFQKSDTLHSKLKNYIDVLTMGFKNGKKKV